MNPEHDKTAQESLDANLSRLICKDNLPPTPTGEEKEAMLARLGRKQAALVNPQPSSPRMVVPFALLGFAAAAGIAALFAAGVLFSDPAPPASLAGHPEQQAAPARGPAGEGGDDVEVPEPVPRAIVYEVLEETRRLELRDGSTVIAERGTRFTEVAPRSLRLEQGSLYLLVSKADTPLEVITPQGRAEALGTRFLVTAEAGDTRVAVAQGKVRLVRTADAQQLELVRGEEGVLAPTELIRRPAPRLSHLVNWARESLREPERIEAGLVRNGLVVLDPNGQEAKLSLRDYTLDVHIEDGVARTTIDQTFFNHLQSNTEGTFYFPLPPRAAVSRLVMYVNGIRNEGGMVERHRGQEIYNDIKYANRDPALLEQLEGNLYKLRIFPLEPRQEKRIFLSFTQNVDELYRTLRYWFPMDHSHENAGRVKVRVRVRSGEEFEAQSSTHNFKRSIEDGDLVLTYEARNIKPDQDLLLTLVPKAGGNEPAETATLERGEQKFLHTRIRPELAGQVDAEPRQWFILNDTSASRTEADLRAQAHILARLLAEADDHDEVAIANLNIDTRRLTGQLVPLRSEAAARAVGRVRDAERLGGTNLAAGIATVRAWIVESGAANPHILYLGDGLATDGAVTTSELTAALDQTIPFLGIAVGKKADLSFLRSAADATGGGAFLMNPEEDLNWRVFDMLASLNTPRLTGIGFEFSGAEGEMQAYSDRNTLAAGEVLTIVASTAGELPETVTVRGTLNGQPWAKDIALDATRQEAGFIPRFWAQRHLEELLKDGETHREEVVRLSKEHYVATPFTSLIVLEDDKMYEDYKVEKGRKDHWAAYEAPDKIPVVREPISWIARTQGQQPATPTPEEIKVDPQTAEEILDTIQPTPPQPLGPGAIPIASNQPIAGYAGNDVRRLLYLAEGYTQLGRFDAGKKGYEAVLRRDRFNREARRGLERIHGMKSDYYRAAYDETRARLLSEVDAAWELAVPSAMPALSGTNVWGSSVEGTDWSLSIAPPPFGPFSANLAMPLSGVTGPTFGRQLLPVESLRAQTGMGGGGALVPGTRGGFLGYVGFRGRPAEVLGSNLNLGFGTFVGGETRGWGYHPWFQHYPLVGNLTTLVPGLTTSPTDLSSMVEMKLGREQRGRVSEEAAALVRAAEERRQAVRIDGTITTPEGCLKGSATTPFFLKEEIISDGTSLHHIYRELGLATRRPVTPSNLALIQGTVPHWPPSLAELEAHWEVTLAEAREKWFEIVLVDPDNDERIHRLKISSDGRLLAARHFRGEDLVSTLTFRYEGNTVVMESGAGARERYEAVEVGVAEALFKADLKGLVTLDLPLRWPVVYERQLAALGEKETEKRKQVLRHLIVARLWSGPPATPADQGKDAKSAWTQLIQLGGGTTPVLDHRTLAAAVNLQSITTDDSEFLAHLKLVTSMGTGQTGRAQVEAFVRDWPESPFVMTLAARCQDWRVWIPLLDIPECRSMGIARISAAAGSQSSAERAGLTTQIADLLITEARAGRPVTVSSDLARFLGREQQANTNWLKLTAAYRDLADRLEELEPHRVAALLDLAIKEKDEELEGRCLDQLLPGIKARQAPLDLVVLADIFSSHGRHEKAVGLYKEALAAIENPGAALLQKAATAVREVDEKQWISWQHQALRKMSDGNYASDKESLGQQYSHLMARAWESGDLDTARQVALEGYELLPDRHSLMAGIAGYFHRQDDDAESWRWLSTILDRHPKDAEASGAVGDWYLAQSLFLEAAAHYAEAHSYDSAHPQWLVKQAGALYRAGKFEEADEVYEELATTDWAHQLKSQVPAEIRQPLVEASRSGLFTTEDPGEEWNTLAFDDEEWTERHLAFAPVEELWNGPFWTRQEFDLVRLPRRIDLIGAVHGVECRVYLNGKLVDTVKDTGSRTRTGDLSHNRTLGQEDLDALQPGRNVLAIRYEKMGSTPRAWFSLQQVFEKQQ